MTTTISIKDFLVALKSAGIDELPVREEGANPILDALERAQLDIRELTSVLLKLLNEWSAVSRIGDTRLSAAFEEAATLANKHYHILDIPLGDTPAPDGRPAVGDILVATPVAGRTTYVGRLQYDNDNDEYTLDSYSVDPDKPIGYKNRCAWRRATAQETAALISKEMADQARRVKAQAKAARNAEKKEREET